MKNNKFPNLRYKSIQDYYTDYAKHLNKSLDLLDLKNLKKISETIEKKIKSGKNIFFCGNGGSSSISNHFLCDFQKGLLLDAKQKGKFISLTSNNDLQLAIGNDLNFNKIFSLQLECLANKNDLLILFSVSGNSKNLIELCKSAKKHKVQIISFVGNEHSKLKKFSDINFNVFSTNYGVAEDIFHISLHVISQFLRQKKFRGSIKNRNF